MRERHIKETDREVRAIVYDDIGKEWVQRFLRRHPELASVRPRSTWFGLKTHHQNGCNGGLMIWRRYGWSSISNQKMHTIWTKAGLQLVRKRLGGVLLMPISVNNSKQSLGIKSGFQWWNTFALMEASFLLLLFLKRKNYQHNGFQQVFMVTGGSIATQKDEQAMSMVWSGLFD